MSKHTAQPLHILSRSLISPQFSATIWIHFGPENCIFTSSVSAVAAEFWWCIENLCPKLSSLHLYFRILHFYVNMQMNALHNNLHAVFQSPQTLSQLPSLENEKIQNDENVNIPPLTSVTVCTKVCKIVLIVLSINVNSIAVYCNLPNKQYWLERAMN